ncbi:MAG: DUF6125 family protein [Promethearchaeota archaeon]
MSRHGDEMDARTEGLRNLLGQLGQILDGLWFLETERRFGFERAYEIDEAVWASYSRKEARRLRDYLGFERPSLDDIREVLSLSLFNQSVQFETRVASLDPVIVHFVVRECKTLVGMRRVGRGDGEVHRICEGIGRVFFENLLGELVPGTTVECLSCPPESEATVGGTQYPAAKCSWVFEFPAGFTGQ